MRSSRRSSLGVCARVCVFVRGFHRRNTVFVSLLCHPHARAQPVESVHAAGYIEDELQAGLMVLHFSAPAPVARSPDAIGRPGSIRRRFKSFVRDTPPLEHAPVPRNAVHQPRLIELALGLELQPATQWRLRCACLRARSSGRALRLLSRLCGPLPVWLLLLRAPQLLVFEHLREAHMRTVTQFPGRQRTAA